MDDPDKHVRIAAAKGLGQLKDRKAVEPLISHFKKEQNFVVKVNLIEGGMGAFQENSIADQLVEALADKHPDVRASAARSLGAYGNPEVLRALVKALRQDGHPLVRLYAAQALGAQAKGQDVLKNLSEAEKEEKQDFVLQAIRAARAQIGRRLK